jgi:CheY-like chemotaxis protein
MSTSGNRNAGPIEVLLVEDNPGDVLLITEELNDGKIACRLNVAGDGVEALDFLRRKGRFPDAPRPELVMTDLNMPRMNGHELIREMKADLELRDLPIIVLTTSDAEKDIWKSYELNINCYLTKPLSNENFREAIESMDDFLARRDRT